MKVKKFLKRLVAVIILILLVILTCHIYVTYFLLPSIKGDILNNTKQISILRTEVQETKGFMDVAFDEIYKLQEQVYTQGEHIQILINAKAEHEAQKIEDKNKIKLNREQDVIIKEEDKGLGIVESATVFTLTVLKQIKDGLTGRFGW